MNKPFVFHPACNPQEGGNHRTVTIRHQGQSVRIKCRTREQADQLGKALIGVFNRHLGSPKPDMFEAVVREVRIQREEMFRASDSERVASTQGLNSSNDPDYRDDCLLGYPPVEPDAPEDPTSGWVRLRDQPTEPPREW